MNLLAFLETRSKRFVIAVGFALVGAVGVLDGLTGTELAFSFFYSIPIALITWLTGQRFGFAASLASALLWLVSNTATGRSYSLPLIHVWNTLVVLCYYAVTVFLLSSLKGALEHEKTLARTDSLTGAVNARFYIDLLQMEINRSQRYAHPFTIAYMDLDNFKTVNDRFGHATGDRVLCTVVDEAKRHLRETDIVARLGGDEFALLLPETGQDSAQVVLAKIQRSLVQEMQAHGWPVTLSIGVVTCIDAAHTADETIKMADDLMYSVKRGGKNGVKYSLCVGKHLQAPDAPVSVPLAVDAGS